MFGKKAKLAAQREAQQAAAEKARAQAFTPVEEPVRTATQDGKIFLESELIADDEIHGKVADAELLSTPANADKDLYDVLDDDSDFDEDDELIDEESDDELIDDDDLYDDEEYDSDDEDDEADEDQDEEQEEEKPEVMIVVDGPEEDDEIVKPAKLVKLPNLVDYMLTLNLSKKMKMNIAMLLLNAYQKFKDIPEEKAIVIECMKKMLTALISA